MFYKTKVLICWCFLIKDLCLFLGIALSVQPLYLGEIAPTALRGAMGMGTSIFITGGILTGQVMGLKLAARKQIKVILSKTRNACWSKKIYLFPFFLEKSLAKGSTGPSSSPPPAFQQSCSSWFCHGSLRALATCLLIKGMMRLVKKVCCCFILILIECCIGNL